MKEEREKGVYSEDHDSDHSDHSDHDDSPRHRADSTQTMASAKTEDLATPLTSPSNSPPQKALFLPAELSQPAPIPQAQYADGNLNFYQAYYDRQTNSVATFSTTGFSYDDLSLGWLDSVALDDTYNLLPQSNTDFGLMNL